MKILVTGASGFVGLAVCRHLLAQGHAVVAAVRRPQSFLPLGVEARGMGDLGLATDWTGCLKGVDAIIHLAARAHHMGEHGADHLTLYRRINRDGAVALAQQAVRAGVERLVLVSTIKVNGEETVPGQPYDQDSPPAPTDSYARSKAEAEQALAELAGRSGLSLAILRPTLVHGAGVKGNLAVLLRLIAKGLPLPFGSVRNSRSMVGVDNLAHALAFLAQGRASGTFLIRDGEDISTPGLVRRLAHHMGRKAHLVPCPPVLLRGLAGMVGQKAAIQRLTGSLTVDDGVLRRAGWNPPFTLDQGLAAMAMAYRE